MVKTPEHLHFQVQTFKDATAKHQLEIGTIHSRWPEIWQLRTIWRLQPEQNRTIIAKRSNMITKLDNKFGWMSAIFSAKTENWQLNGQVHLSLPRSEIMETFASRWNAKKLTSMSTEWNHSSQQIRSRNNRNQNRNLRRNLKICPSLIHSRQSSLGSRSKESKFQRPQLCQLIQNEGGVGQEKIQAHLRTKQCNFHQDGLGRERSRWEKSKRKRNKHRAARR